MTRCHIQFDRVECGGIGDGLIQRAGAAVVAVFDPVDAEQHACLQPLAPGNSDRQPQAVCRWPRWLRSIWPFVIPSAKEAIRHIGCPFRFDGCTDFDGHPPGCRRLGAPSEPGFSRVLTRRSLMKVCGTQRKRHALPRSAAQKKNRQCDQTTPAANLTPNPSAIHEPTILKVNIPKSLAACNQISIGFFLRGTNKMSWNHCVILVLLSPF